MAQITGTLDINTAPALKELNDLRAKIAGMDSSKIPVSIDTGKATAAVTSMKGQMTKAGADAGASTGGAAATSLAASMKSKLAGIDFKSMFSGAIGGGVAGLVATGTQMLTAGMKSAVNIGADYQTALQSVSAVTGLTGAGLADIGVRARELAKEFGGDAKTQLAGFQTLFSKFGVDLAKAPDAVALVTKNVNILSKASGLDAAASVEALSNAMLQFGVNAEDPARLAAESSRFINVMAASAKEGAAEIPQLTEAILAAGTTASGLGLSFEGTNAALQAMAVGGKVGSEAGIGLRNVMISMVKTTTEADGALSQMGLSSDTLAQLLTTKGLPAALDALKAGMDKLPDSAARAEASALLFGKENVASAGILINNIELMKQYETRITGTGEALVAAKANMATFSEGMSRVGAFIQDFAITAFEAVSAFVSFFTDRVAPAVLPALSAIGGYFERLWSVVKPILIGVGALFISNLIIAVTNVATAVRVAFKILADTFDSLMSAVEPLITMFTDLFGSIGGGKDMMTSFTQQLDDAVAIISKVGEVVSSLISIFISYATTGIDLLVSAVKPLVGWFVSLFTSTKDVSKATSDGLSPLQKMITFLDKLVITIDSVKAQLEAFKDVIRDFFDAWNSLDFGKAMQVLAGAGARIKKAGTDVAEAAQMKKVNDEIKKNLDQLEKDRADGAAKQKALDDAEKKRREEAAAKRKAEEEKRKAAAAAADAAKKKEGEKDKEKESELERQLKLYTKTADAVGALFDQERARVRVLEALGRITKSQGEIKLKEIEAREVDKLMAAAASLLKIKSDQLGLFVESSIKFDADETDGALRELQNKLAERAVTVRSSVAEFVKPLVIPATLKIDTNAAQDAIAGLSGTFVDAFGNINFSELLIPEDTGAKAADRIDEVTKSMAGGLTTYQQAMKDLNDVTGETASSVDKLNKAITDVFQTSFEESRRALAVAMQDLQALAFARVEFDNKTFANEKEQADAREGLEKNLAEKKSKFFETVGAASGQVGALLLTDSKAAGKAAKQLAVDTAGGLLTLYVAPLIAGFLSFLGPFAAPVAAAMIATLRGLFATAVASFDTGGPTGGARGEVRGIVHGGEWVARPDVYERNKELLDFLHRGGTVPLRAHTNNRYSDVVPIASALERMNSAIGTLASRVDRAASTTQKTQSSISLDVGFDNYLYERRRRRAAIRGLR